MNKRVLVFTLLGLVLAGVAEWDHHQQVLSPVRKLDRFWVKFCLGNTGEKIGNPSITVVRIPDSYEPIAVGGTAPGSGELSRLDYATFLYGLGKLEPKSVSFLPTPVFSSPSPLNATDINPLRDAALQLPKITLATVVSGGNPPANKPGNDPRYPPIQSKGDISRIPEIKWTVIPADPDLLANGDGAFAGFEGEKTAYSPSKNPEIQLVARQGDQVVPGFVLASAARFAGIGFDQISIDLQSSPAVIRVGDRYKIPVSSSGSMELPSHAGLTHAMYEITSRDKEGREQRNYQFALLDVGEIALPAVDGDTVAKSVVDRVLAGKLNSISRNLVLLGYDRDRTIVTRNEERLSPLLLAARAIATIQSGRYTSVWPLWARGAAYLSLLILGSILLSIRKLAIPLIFTAILAGLAIFVFIFKLTLAWTPPAAIFGLFALMLLSGLLIRRRPDAIPAE